MDDFQVCLFPVDYRYLGGYLCLDVTPYWVDCPRSVVIQCSDAILHSVDCRCLVVSLHLADSPCPSRSGAMTSYPAASNGITESQVLELPANPWMRRTVWVDFVGRVGPMRR